MPELQKRRNINKELGISLKETYPLDFAPDILRATLLKWLLAYIKKYTVVFQKKKVSFIGGGIGREIIQLRSSIPFYAINVDINLKLLEIARCHYRKIGLECSCVVADGMQLPFKNDVFDLVVLYESLHHMDDLTLCLEESLRVGKTICIVDRRKCFISKIGRLLGLIQPEIDGLYAYELDMKRFKQWLKKHPDIQLTALKRHLLYLLVINKNTQFSYMRFIPLGYLYIPCVRIINILLGFMGNGVVIVVQKNTNNLKNEE